MGMVHQRASRSIQVSGLLVLQLTLFSCDVETIETIPSPIPDGVLVQVSASPQTIAPGSVTTIEIQVPAATSATLRLTIDSGPEVDIGAPQREGQYLVARFETTISDVPGDHLVTIRGESDAGNIIGHAVVSVNTTPLGCAPGTVQEAGRCVPTGPGHGLTVLGIAHVGVGHTGGYEGPEKRNMMHPREVTILGSATVGCHTDHIGIIWLGDYEWVQDLQAAEPDTDLDALDQGDGTTPVTEALVTEAGLLHCESFKLDRTRRIGVISARGTFGEDGGLATWRIPQTDAPPYDPPELLDYVTDSGGFEGIALSPDGRTLYAARKPNRLTIWNITDNGKLELLSDYVVPAMGSAWGVAVYGSTVFMTDPTQHAPTPVLSEGPAGTAHYAHAHDSATGRLFSIDVADPSAPQALGWNDTAGAAKGLAVLSDQTIAVAVGAAGIQLFDVSDIMEPIGINLYRTPSTVNEVGYGNGYLVAADWNAVRLYDASEQSALRLLDASDAGLHSELLGREVGPDGLPLLPPSGSLALGWSGIQTESGSICDPSDGPCAFIATDIDRIFLGRISPGQRSPRIVLQDSRVSVRGGVGNPVKTVAIRVSNDGRDTLWVRVKETESVRGTSGESLILGPGADGVIEATLARLDTDEPPTRIILATNDPFTPERTVNVLVTNEQYQAGDMAPQFSLPAVNHCDNSGCDFNPQCVTSEAVLESGRPIFLAFFSSW
jgi:hypothetical protein